MSDRTTLDCASVTPYLSAFADGELAEPLRAEVAAHTSVCDVCAMQLDRIHAVDDLLARLPRTAPSAGVFERTLAAATRQAPTDPRAVIRETLAGGRGAKARRRLRQLIAPEIPATGAFDTTPSSHRGRARWVAATIPLVAALLLIALAATLFNRFPSLARQTATPHPTPSAANVLEQTHTAVNAVASQLAFTPAIPTYLPAGAGAPTVRVGPQEQVQADSRYVDIVWTFSSGPAQSLHLRELPAGLSFYGYTATSGATATLAWSLPGSAGWQALASSTCAGCLAVGETRSGMQLALDAQPRGSASATAVIAWLRMVSLSLDGAYQPLGVTLAPPDSAMALRYQATVSDGLRRPWTWTVIIDSAHGGQQHAQATGNSVDVTEIISGKSGVLLDNTARIYQPLATLPPTAQPPTSVTQTLFAAGEFVATGELWNLGKQPVNLPDGRRMNVYVLYRVNATQAEYVYADPATGQVIALVIDTGKNEHPGGPNGSQTFISTTACQPYTVTYTSIEYIPTSQLSPALFSTARPSSDWRQGTVSPAFTCQG